MVERYERGKGKSKEAPIVVQAGGNLTIYNGNHRTVAAIRKGQRTIESARRPSRPASSD